MSNLIEYIITSIQNNIAFALIAFSVLIVIYLLSLAIIFNKIGHKTMIAFIPIYNVMSLLSILNIPQWMVLLIFIPFVNILGFTFLTILIGYKLGTLCRKNILMKIGLMLLPPIFYPLLAFTDIDIDGSKANVVIQPEVKKQFTLDSVEFVDDIEVPVALNLSDAANVDKITIKKLRPTVQKREPVETSTTTIAEHLSKANKERPTAQDLTFDYNLIYNSIETKEEKVEEIEQKVEEVIQPKIEPQIPEEEKVETVVDDTPIVPIVHDIFLEAAQPVDSNNVGPVPINKRYENQMEANRRQKELQREKEQQQEEEIKEVIEPTVILDNGPVSIDSSLAGLMASAPDFNAPAKEIKPIVVKEEKVEVKQENIPTTSVQEIVSMNIIEPSQLPVGIIPVVEEEKTVEDVVEEPEIKSVENNVSNSNASSLLRPVVAPNTGHALIDKACPQCSAKMKRDCPVCIICGYRF